MLDTIAASYPELLSYLGIAATGISITKSFAGDYISGKTADLINKLIRNKADAEDLKRNHHLMKVVRLAMLHATLQMNGALKEEAKLLGGTSGKYITEFTTALDKWLKGELKAVKKLDDSHYIRMPAYEQIAGLIAGEATDFRANAKNDLSQLSKEHWILELKHELAMDLPAMATGYICSGWQEKGKSWDWFELVCFWFANLLAAPDMEIAKTKFQDRLLSELSIDMQAMMAKLQAILPDGNYAKKRLDELVEQLGRIEEKVDLTLDEVKFLRARIVSMETMMTELLQHSVGNREAEAQIKIIEQELAETREKLRNSNAELEEEKIKRLDLENQLLAEKEPLKTKAAEAVGERNFDEAKKLLRQTIEERNQKLADDYYQLGRVLELNLEYREALTYYELAAKIPPPDLTI